MTGVSLKKEKITDHSDEGGKDGPLIKNKTESSKEERQSSRNKSSRRSKRPQTPPPNFKNRSEDSFNDEQ